MLRRNTGRIVWKEVSKDSVTFSKDQPINFIWKPTQFNFKLYSVIDRVMFDSYNYQSSYIEKQLCINHLENIQGICTKTGLIRTLKQYYKDR